MTDNDFELRGLDLRPEEGSQWKSCWGIILMWFISLTLCTDNFLHRWQWCWRQGGWRQRGRGGRLRNNFDVYFSRGSPICSWGCIIFALVTMMLKAGGLEAEGQRGASQRKSCQVTQNNCSPHITCPTKSDEDEHEQYSPARSLEMQRYAKLAQHVLQG